MKSILENLTFLSLPLLKKIVFFASRRRAAPVQNRIRELNEDYASNKKKNMEMFFSFRRKEPKERRRETCSFLSFLQEGALFEVSKRAAPVHAPPIPFHCQKLFPLEIYRPAENRSVISGRARQRKAGDPFLPRER